MTNHTVLDKPTGAKIIEIAESAQSLSEMENTICQLVQKLGNMLLHMWLLSLTPRYCSPTMPCPHCGQEAQYRRKRWGKLLTMFGDVRCRCAYYVCSTCRQGHYPLDEQLGLRPNAMSAEVERLAGMTGVQMPFGKGRDVFEELTLLSLSDQSLDKATQSYGREVEQ